MFFHFSVPRDSGTAWTSAVVVHVANATFTEHVVEKENACPPFLPGLIMRICSNIKRFV